MPDAPPARDLILRELTAPKQRGVHYSPDSAASLLDAFRDEVLADFCYGDAREVLARRRDQVLTEAAQLIQAQRAAVYADAGRHTADGMDRARDLLLAARTTATQEG